MYIDDNDKEVIRIERYYRDTDTNSWVIKDVWHAQIVNATAQKIEENIRYIKLVFPSEIGKSWDGNAFNTIDYQEYEITDITTLDIDGLNFLEGLFRYTFIILICLYFLIIYFICPLIS